jgi:hypothetical protein
MDHTQILRRAWELTWRYRVLWVFGILLALTTSRGSGNNGFQYSLGRDDLFAPGGPLFGPGTPPRIPAEIVGTLIAIGIGLACLALVLVVISLVVRYVAETALIRLVDDHETTGERRRVGEGFRLGWSRTAWRLFLIDLLIGVPVAVVFVVLFLVALAPLLLWFARRDTVGSVGVLATIGMVVLFIWLAVAVAVVLTLLVRFFRRACALDGLGVVESIRHGFGVVRDHFRDVAIMWLIMVGVSLGAGVLFFLAAILLVALGLLAGAVPALVVGGLASMVSEGVLPWILGILVGAPVFFLVLVLPLLFLSGLFEIFKSSVWTLTYRQLRALDKAELEPGTA